LNDENEKKNLNITPYVMLNGVIMGFSGAFILLTSKNAYNILITNT
jgi:hypothetical protein